MGSIPSTSQSRRTWREGLKLAATAELAKVDSALTAAWIIRDGKAIAAREAESVLVKSGDVVELARRMD